MVILPHFLFYYSHKSKALEVPAAFVFCSCDSPRGPDPFPMKKPKLPQPFCSENMRPVHHEIPHAEVARLGCQSIRKRPGQSLALTCSTQTRCLDIRARYPAVLHRSSLTPDEPSIQAQEQWQAANSCDRRAKKRSKTSNPRYVCELSAMNRINKPVLARVSRNRAFLPSLSTVSSNFARAVWRFAGWLPTHPSAEPEVQTQIQTANPETS